MCYAQPLTWGGPVVVPAGRGAGGGLGELHVLHCPGAAQEHEGS